MFSIIFVVHIKINNGKKLIKGLNSIERKTIAKVNSIIKGKIIFIPTKRFNLYLL
ncbi:hypothetical protein HMPREF9413_5365 [Paenibacillus sp. HGF7]|nr:hypothetical protein HMPREF9413_5365 [Paenibacillus sp. HGF7]